jgi:hypothetical protein
MEAALIPNPIRKVLSIFQSCGVRALLMGGQACVFWLREARTPALIRSLIRNFPIEAAGIMAQARPLLKVAVDADDDAIEMELNLEERRERILDRAYWGPLKSELEKMRHGVFDF